MSPQTTLQTAPLDHAASPKFQHSSRDRDDSVTRNKAVREMETRIRELERQLGRKALEVEVEVEVEILK